MSVTGRTVGISAVVLTVFITGGVEEASEGVWPESMGGGGVGEGKTVSVLGGVGGRGDISLTQGDVGSNCSCSGSITGGMGESLFEGVDVDCSTISNWVGMSEFALMEGGRSVEMWQSGTGTGEGVGDGGRLSCMDGVGDSARGDSGKGGSIVRVTSLISFSIGLGDSNVELGGGSMVGVVQIWEEASTVWGRGGVERSNEGEGVAADSFVREGPMPFNSGLAEFFNGSTDSSTTD